MNILAIADTEARLFYDFYRPGCLDEFDLIIACGDLNRAYLEFLVTMGNKPLLYVHGNHDESFDTAPPEGCTCIDDKLVVVNGVRILGLGGSFRYRNGRYMFTEEEMRRRIRRLLPRIWLHGGVDILVTHAPARGLNDFDSLSHRGFECFHLLLKWFHPRFFLHGHIHKNYGMHIPQITRYGQTTVVNAFEYCRVNFEQQE